METAAVSSDGDLLYKPGDEVSARDVRSAGTALSMSVRRASCWSATALKNAAVDPMLDPWAAPEPSDVLTVRARHGASCARLLVLMCSIAASRDVRWYACSGDDRLVNCMLAMRK